MFLKFYSWLLKEQAEGNDPAVQSHTAGRALSI